MADQRTASLAWIAALWVVSGTALVSDGVTAFSSSWQHLRRAGATTTLPSDDATIILSRRSSPSRAASTLQLPCSADEPQPHHHGEHLSSRRQWITQVSVPFVVVLTAAGTPAPALAAKQPEDDAVEIDPAAVREAFDAVRREVLSDSGGVAYLQTAVESRDFPALLEFTKTYDQRLRKGAMGRAKKLLASKEAKEAATAAANGVTFDLIGINRSARPGQENVETAAKYLQELKDDVQKFLDLEPKF